MSFYHRYELVRLVHGGEPKTFEAREIASGRPVLLHLWSMGEEARRSELLVRLTTVMRTDPAVLLGSVIEVQESAEPPYAVSVPEEGFPGLQPWLEGKLSPGASPSLPPSAPAPPPAMAPLPVAEPPQQQPGEFTRMFGGAAVSAPPPPPAPAPPAPSQQQPGEFTRLFGGHSTATPASPAQHQPGPFTRQFASAPPPVEPPRPPSAPAFQVAPPFGPPEAPPKPEPHSGPGEFTKLFGSPLGANPLPVEEIERGVLAPPPAPSHARPFSGPSDFTIQFGHSQDSGDAAPPPPPPEFNKNLAATGLFSVPLPLHAEPQQPAAPAGPGEFTRVMMRPAGFQPPQAPAAPAAYSPAAPPAPGTLASAPIPNRKPWLAPLVAVLTTAVVLLLIAVIVLLLKR